VAEIPSIQVALAKVKKSVGSVGKDQKNLQQNFLYRGIDGVVNAVSGPLAAEGVITTPEVLDYTYENVEIGKNRTPMAHVLGKVKYTFTGPAGDCLEAVVLAESMDSGDKAVAKMMSVAYRIALLQVLTLPTDSPDPDSETYERSGGSAPKAARTRTAAAPKSAQEHAEAIAKLTSIDDLRATYLTVSSAGFLMTEIAVPGTGEAMKLKPYMERRSDELVTPKSPGPADGENGGGGDQ
jgi:ERF superfamily